VLTSALCNMDKVHLSARLVVWWHG